MAEWERCRKCFKRLDYQIGSIRWRCANGDHLCIPCMSKRNLPTATLSAAL